MNIKISYENLESFIGDVKPIWLISDVNLKFKGIEWSVAGDAVEMKKCDGCFHGAFKYGVFVTFVKAGEAVVKANYDGKCYTCHIISRERHKYSSNEKMNYYIGDLHTHTTPEHTHDKYLIRSEYLPKDYLTYIKKENLRDLAVMTDHAETIDLENFFRNFSEYELMKDEMEPIVYAGCENEIMYTEKDRFGIPHRVSGELLAINAPSFSQANTYPEFFNAFENTPYAIGIFAHPHVIGISTKGVWNYRPRLNNPPELTSLVKYIEVLNAPSQSQNMINEYVYSEALDGGYRVSTTCGSDMHRDWDFNAFPGATIIMAPEKSREAFTDALLNLRAYACESGNIKLKYSVNGSQAPCDIPLTDSYHFKVEIDYFKKDDATRPIRCEVISDGGVTVKTITDANFDSFEFDVFSDSARWFYLKLIDSNTHRTFSPPVFTGRAIIPYKIDDLIPIDKSGFSIYESCGSDASALIDNDPLTPWQAEKSHCELIIDMGKSRKISALGNYAASIDIKELRKLGIEGEYAEAMFPVDYVISTGINGTDYDVAANGIFRSFAGEEIVRFSPRDARYIKLEILSTAGSRLGRAPYDTLPLKLCELSVFE